MKKIISILILSVFLLAGCEPPVQYPQYRYAVEDQVPDSNKVKMAKWITETVSAASLHMTGGDYEDPEDLVQQCQYTADKIFAVPTEGLERLEGEHTYWFFIPKKDLTESQLEKFERLKKK